MENENVNKEIVVAENPAVLMRHATDVAGVSREIVMKTAVNISGKKYVKVEGWQAIAIAHGCMLSARDVERIDGGVRAIGEVRRGSDGMVLATAEGFVGDDESTWGKRPEYAKRAMAQTRAMSRAARSAFAHVVVMIDSSLSTTPAEEMYEQQEEPKKAHGNIDQLKKSLSSAKDAAQLTAIITKITTRSWTPEEEKEIADIVNIRRQELAS